MGVQIFLEIMRRDMRVLFFLKECQFSYDLLRGGANFPRIKCVGIPDFPGCKFSCDTGTTTECCDWRYLVAIGGGAV